MLSAGIWPMGMWKTLFLAFALCLVSDILFAALSFSLSHRYCQPKQGVDRWRSVSSAFPSGWFLFFIFPLPLLTIIITIIIIIISLYRIGIVYFPKSNRISILIFIVLTPVSYTSVSTAGHSSINHGRFPRSHRDQRRSQALS